jgi:hypothetical protein
LEEPGGALSIFLSGPTQKDCIKKRSLATGLEFDELITGQQVRQRGKEIRGKFWQDGIHRGNY